MKKSFIAALLVFLSVTSVLVSQTTDAVSYNNADLYQNSANTYDESLVFGEILRNYNVDTLITVATGYGVEWTGNYYVVSNFSTNNFYKIRPDWSLIQALPVTGGSGLFRDMEFAKGYLWGVSVTNAIFKVDTATFAQVGSIPLPSGIQARALAWDSGRNAFWVSTASFNGFMRAYDTLGVAIAGSDIPVANNVGAFYGAAYDNVSPNGPYLIIASDIANNTVANQNQVKYVRWRIATLPPVRVDSITMTIPLIANSGTAGLAHGGCDFSSTLIPNKGVIISLAQGTPDRVIVVEISDLTAITSNGTEVPSGYSLSQNFPNPFNPSTSIKFDLPKDGNIRLSVMDVLGREVSVVADEFKKAGSYTATFDASKLSSGIYFYSLQTKNFTITKKMILVR